MPWQAAVNFWAPWCEPCKALDEVFATLAADNGHAGFLRVRLSWERCLLAQRLCSHPSCCPSRPSPLHALHAGLTDSSSDSAGCVCSQHASACLPPRLPNHLLACALPERPAPGVTVAPVSVPYQSAVCRQGRVASLLLFEAAALVRLAVGVVTYQSLGECKAMAVRWRLRRCPT